jgi:hypothetical protein
MPTPQQTFSVVDGHLVCTTTGGSAPTTHRCPLSTYQLLAFEMQELEVKGFTADSLVKHMKAVLAMEVSVDEVSAVLAFLTEQQCLEPVGRDGTKFKPAGAFTFDDAMISYHQLRERGQPE